MRPFNYLIMAAALIATPAYADDFPGGRVEANIGWDHVRGKVSYKDTAFPADDFSASENTDGLVFGATAGYDIPLGGSLYAGIEGSFDFADNKRCEAVFGDDAACFKVKRNYAVGGRLGTAVSKRALLYVGAAYINGKANISYDDNIDPNNNFSVSDTRGGYRVSVGTEYRLVGSVFTKIEYRYSNYNDFKYAEGTESVSLGFDRNQVVGGMGIRF